MFDIAWSELLIVAIVAILVVGPKELPALLRSLGQMLGKLRRHADDFRRQFDEAVKEAGAEDLQQEIRSLQQHNPLTQVRDAINGASREPRPRGCRFRAGGAGREPAACRPAYGRLLPGASAPPKETAANGSTHDLRVNGEHRPAG